MSPSFSDRSVYRAPMRARDRAAPPGAGAEYGVEHGLVGVGDELVAPPDTLDEAVAAATDEHGAKAGRMVHAFAAVPDGAFVWTRVADGTYRLGCLAGRWRYDCSPQAREVGIRHVRPARWLDRPFVGDELPNAVVATFARGGHNFQRIHDGRAETRTAELWAALAALIAQPAPPPPGPSIRLSAGRTSSGDRAR